MGGCRLETPLLVGSALPCPESGRRAGFCTRSSGSSRTAMRMKMADFLPWCQAAAASYFQGNLHRTSRPSRRNRHPTDREVLRRLLLDHRPLAHGQDRRGVPLLRQRHVHEADRLGLSPVTATSGRRRPNVAAGLQSVDRGAPLSYQRLYLPGRGSLRREHSASRARADPRPEDREVLWGDVAPSPSS